MNRTSVRVSVVRIILRRKPHPQGRVAGDNERTGVPGYTCIEHDTCLRGFRLETKLKRKKWGPDEPPGP
jgi:hypothetical protein